MKKLSFLLLVMCLIATTACGENEQKIAKETIPEKWDLDREYSVMYDTESNKYSVKEYYMGMSEDIGLPTPLYLFENEYKIGDYEDAPVVEIYYITLLQQSLDMLAEASLHIDRKIDIPQAGTVVKGRSSDEYNIIEFICTLTKNELIFMSVISYENGNYRCRFSYYKSADL